MIRLDDIQKTFQIKNQEVVAVDGVSLHIQRGEVFGIIGYSGAGKSTLVRCINLLERPEAGSVVVDGQNLTAMGSDQLRKARQQIGMIFQQFNLMTSRTVAGNVAYPLEVAGQPRPEIQRRVEELLKLVGLSDKAHAYPAQLSGGQKQRVGIARALANNPAVLLCDEATSALDPLTTVSILDLLEEINRKLRLTIVLVTHEMPVVQSICHRVAVMEKGRVVELGTVHDVFTNPQSLTARQFVSPLRSRRRDEDQIALGVAANV